MVNKNLAKNLQQLKESADPLSIDNYLSTLFQFIEARVGEEEEDGDMKIIADDAEVCTQFVIIETGAGHWLSARHGEIQYGDGENSEATVKIIATADVMTRILTQELSLYGTQVCSIFEDGHLKWEGNREDYQFFDSFLTVTGEYLEEHYG